MKRLLACFLLLSLALCGCGQIAAPENRVLVSIEETEGCTVENNGQLVLPGEDATFTLRLDYGFALASVDYRGEYRSETNKRSVTLTLENVRYPTRAVLNLTSRYCTITYDANGGTALHGTETQITKNYDLTYHKRPNTERGTELFARDGCTLLCWNTKPDGTGERVGLGSRVTAYGTLALYAQWAAWTGEDRFQWESDGEAVTITDYDGADETLVIPADLGGRPVTAIAAGAFRETAAKRVVLPDTLLRVEDGAFQDCAVQELTLFDNIETISDAAFLRCDDLQTLYVNAIEAPYGYLYRKESCYADKADLLILSGNRNRMVFYGGCSVWYNLDGTAADKALGGDYSIVNMGLNGTVNSVVQMQIMGAYLHAGDVLFHTPELASRRQLLIDTDMTEEDRLLWCGLENNYDLFSLVDLRTVGGAFDSLCAWLSEKSGRAAYQQYYTDDDGRNYMDSYGCVPFYRSTTADSLADTVSLNPELIDPDAMARMRDYYGWYQSKGVRIYVSYACTNMDAVPESQRGNAATMDALFRAAIREMDGPILISELEDYLYRNEDFFDTNYHLRSEPAQKNTALWLRDLTRQLAADGLWEAAE